MAVKDTVKAEIVIGLTTPSKRAVTIAPPNFETATVLIVGSTPLVLHRFSQKSKAKMQTAQEAGSQGAKGKKREAKSFDDDYQAARHISRDGWDGFSAAGLRNALISACRTVGFKMTIAKLSVFVVADGYDDENTPLVRITKGAPHMDVRHARNSNGGTDLRSRPMWQEGWEARPTFRWDADQFSASDLINLLARAGLQVGIGEGRPDSRLTAGVGWGQFDVAG